MDQIMETEHNLFMALECGERLLSCQRPTPGESGVWQELNPPRVVVECKWIVIWIYDYFYAKEGEKKGGEERGV